MNEKKDMRGGARPGGGRRKTDNPKIRHMFRATDSEYNEIKENALMAKRSISRFLVEQATINYKKN